MAETSVMCFSRFPSVPSISRATDARESSSPFVIASSSKFSVSYHRSSRRLLRFVAKATDPGNVFGDDSFGFFPWNDGGSEIQWVPEERVTLFTADGLIQIGGSMVPRRVSASDCMLNKTLDLSYGGWLFCIYMSPKKQGKLRTSQRFQRFQESDYMDPEQSLCLGALFDIAATNGLDTGRRLCIFGFCRSIEMLSDVVEDTVLEHGGEVVAAKKASKGGLHEKLTMTVAVPLLWGVPPVSETLHLAVQSGGGIVEKVYWQWDFL
ncbi:D-tagatose-1,6-bisphosphate aldolase subunit [Quillaja saponaria]|uniref:D-tagatose-1,6-bisphosphate aldolase subunit n=1 Tax=Quillaja saponaria TaxID=32244 RepID=A0AAD7VIK5_QUISA|nr:D-tagatose-1,6-bisphosphate aldolase subunit [Quillaja saponaria]